MKKLATALLLALPLVLGSAAPVPAPSPTVHSGACETLEKSADFRAFLAVNPSLAQSSIADKLEAYRERGEAEWKRMLGRFTAFIPGAPLEVEDTEWTGSVARRYKIAPDNPLPLMDRFVQAFAAQAAGDNDRGYALAEAALAQARPRWGERNAGLVLGYTTIAQAQLARGNASAAIAAAERGIAVIDANPDRALPLAAMRVNFLNLMGQAGELSTVLSAWSATDPRQAQWEQEAQRTRRRAALYVASPLLELTALLPGIQPAAQWANQRGRSVYPMLQPLWQIATVAAAVVPSVGGAKPVERRVTSPAALVGEAHACLRSSMEATVAGDLKRADAASAALIGLINEGNVATLARGLASDSDDAKNDPFWDAVDDLTALVSGEDDEDGMALSQTLAVINAQGRLADVARQIERGLTPAAAAEVLKAVAKSNPDFKLDKVNAYRRELGDALVYVRTALAMLFRPVTQSDVATMRAAAQFAAGSGGARIRAFLADIGVEIDNEDAKTFFASPMGRLTNEGVPALLASFGWGAAFTTQDVRSMREFDGFIADRYGAYLGAGAPAEVAAALQLYRNPNASPGARTMGASPVLLRAILDSIPDLADRMEDVFYVADMDEEEDKEGNELGGVRMMVDLPLAMLLTPMAAEDGMWREITILDEYAFQTLLRATGESDEFPIDINELADEPGFEAVQLPVAYYLYALTNQGRGKEAVALLDRLLPQLKRIYQQEDQRDVLANFLADQVLAAAAVAYMDQRRYDDAHFFVRLRLRRDSGFGDVSGEGRGGLAALSLGDDVPALRGPAAQMIALSFGLQRTDAVWNDVLRAIEASRRSPASRAYYLRSVVEAGPPARREAYEELVRVSANQRRCADIASGAFSKRAGCGAGSNAYSIQRATQALLATLDEPTRRQLSGELDINALRRTLRPGELVVSPLALNQRVAVFTLDRDGGPDLVYSPDGDTFEEYRSFTNAVTELGKQFAITDQDRAGAIATPDAALLAQLYRVLISPVAARAQGARHLLWSPDTVTANVPVAALRAPAPLVVSGEPATLQLGLARPISFTPSFAALQLRRATAPSPASLSLAVGDIPYTGRPAATLSGPADPLAQPATPLARRTLTDFARITGGRVIEGRNATPASLGAFRGQSIEYLMFYAHGASPGSPLGAGIILSPGADGEALLGPAEIMQLGIRPRYVILAACSTGAGTGFSAQPYSGIVQSFFLIGAQSVLSAQQRLDPAATAQISLEVLRAMRSGAAPAEALRRAQRGVANASTTANPVYWAQMIWVGDGG